MADLNLLKFQQRFGFIHLLFLAIEIDILTAEQQTEEANHSLREAIICNNMTKIQEAQSPIEMPLEVKKRSSSQLEELKPKKQKLS